MNFGFTFWSRKVYSKENKSLTLTSKASAFIFSVLVVELVLLVSIRTKFELSILQSADKSFLKSTLINFLPPF